MLVAVRSLCSEGTEAAPVPRRRLGSILSLDQNPLRIIPQGRQIRPVKAIMIALAVVITRRVAEQGRVGLRAVVSGGSDRVSDGGVHYLLAQ